MPLAADCCAWLEVFRPAFLDGLESNLFRRWGNRFLQRIDARKQRLPLLHAHNHAFTLPMAFATPKRSRPAQRAARRSFFPRTVCRGTTSFTRAHHFLFLRCRLRHDVLVTPRSYDSLFFTDAFIPHRPPLSWLRVSQLNM